MADDTKAPKTKSVGKLSKSKLAKVAGWKEYEKAAKAFAEAKRQAEDAKTVVRKHLETTLKLENLDFTDDDEAIRVFQNLQQRTRTSKRADLDDRF